MRRWQEAALRDSAGAGAQVQNSNKLEKFQKKISDWL